MTTSTEVELRAPANGRVSREWIALLEPAAALASQVAGTGFVPSSIRSNPAAIVAAILYGDELGIGPMQSLAKINVIEGKPTLSAEAQRALVLAAGHHLRVDEATATRVTISGRRDGDPPDAWSSVTWTLDDAKRAGLAGRQNWRSYPRQMLAARATAELARLIFADVVGGLAATEEIEDVDPLAFPESPEPDVPAKKTTRRRRRSPALEAPAEGPGATGEETVSSPGPDLPPLPDEPADSLLEPGPEAATPSVDPEPGESRGDAPAEDSGSDGGTSPSEAAGEVARDDETTASSVPASDAGASPADEPKATKAQKTNLDRLVGTLRETEVELPDGFMSTVVSTGQLWAAAATRRNVEVDLMIDVLGGRDEAGVLHWSPLRDSLTKSEASDLTSKLEDRARKWGVS